MEQIIIIIAVVIGFLLGRISLASGEPIIQHLKKSLRIKPPGSFTSPIKKYQADHSFDEIPNENEI